MEKRMVEKYGKVSWLSPILWSPFALNPSHTPQSQPSTSRTVSLTTFITAHSPPLILLDDLAVLLDEIPLYLRKMLCVDERFDSASHSSACLVHLFVLLLHLLLFLLHPLLLLPSASFAPSASSSASSTVGLLHCFLREEDGLGQLRGRVNEAFLVVCSKKSDRKWRLSAEHRRYRYSIVSRHSCSAHRDVLHFPLAPLPRALSFQADNSVCFDPPSCSRCFKWSICRL